MYLQQEPQSYAICLVRDVGLEEAFKRALRKRQTMNFEYFDMVLDNLITLAMEK